jgi:mono/diheme cytochrome c family protein
LRKVQEILGKRSGKDVFLYSISIDPTHDTPEVLKAYAKKYKAGPGWSFLTGKEQDIIHLRKKLGLYIDDIQNNKDNPDDHNLNLIIGNESSGQWMKRSPFENPYVLATQLTDWLHNWKVANKNQNSYVNAPKVRNISRGESLFRTRCSSCHTIGGGHGVGPDLLNVVAHRDATWLQRWLMEPDIMLKEKDPLAMSLYAKYKIPMPNMRLTEEDVKALISHLEKETAYQQRRIKK